MEYFSAEELEAIEGLCNTQNKQEENDHIHLLKKSLKVIQKTLTNEIVKLDGIVASVRKSYFWYQYHSHDSKNLILMFKLDQSNFGCRITGQQESSYIARFK